MSDNHQGQRSSPGKQGNGVHSQSGPGGEMATLEDIGEYILTLEDHMRQCERAGKYVEAQTALMKIEELKNEANKRRKEQLRARHLNEKLEIEEAHLSEFNQFNEYWDKRMTEFNEEAAKAEQEMMSRHQDELAKFEEELNRSLPPKPKDSSELLNLRKIEENLARQKDYIEAHKVQQKCMMLEKEEQDKWSLMREQKIKNQLAQLINKQQQEISALRKRVVSAQEEHRKARSAELERLIQKYQNIKKELEVQQQLEMQKLEKSLKTSSTGSVMRSTFGGSKFVSPGSKGGLNQSRAKLDAGK